MEKNWSSIDPASPSAAMATSNRMYAAYRDLAAALIKKLKPNKW